MTSKQVSRTSKQVCGGGVVDHWSECVCQKKKHLEEEISLEEVKESLKVAKESLKAAKESLDKAYERLQVEKESLKEAKEHQERIINEA